MLFRSDNNYLANIATALRKSPAAGDVDLNANQAGPALLQTLLAYSAQMERHDAVESTASLGSAIYRGASYATAKMLYVEAVRENEATFTVTSPKELASVSIPSVTGNATLGEHVAMQLALQPLALAHGEATLAATRLFEDRKSTRLNSSHLRLSRMPSSA